MRSGKCLLTCSRCAGQSADTPPPGGSGSCPAGRSHRTRDTRGALCVYGSSGGRTPHTSLAASWEVSTAYMSETGERGNRTFTSSRDQQHVDTGLSSPSLTEFGVALICWKWVTRLALPANCVWHSGHLKLWYCSTSAFLQGRGISAWGP